MNTNQNNVLSVLICGLIPRPEPDAARFVAGFSALWMTIQTVGTNTFDKWCQTIYSSCTVQPDRLEPLRSTGGNRVTKNIGLLVLLCVCFAGSLSASTITLYFSGVTSAGTPTSTSIAAGTPFSGSLSFDPATPNTGAADVQHRNFNDVLATFNFDIGSGLYDFSTTSVGIEVDHNYGLNFGGGDVIWFWANSQTITGTGQATNPIFNGVTNTVLLWRKTGDGIFSTANTINEPPMETLGNWTFAGIDLSVLQGGSNSEHYLLSFSSISQTAPAGPTVPEPATIGLVGAGVLALGFGVRRAHQKGASDVGHR